MVQTLPNLVNPLAVAELENVLGLGAGVALRGPLPDAALAVALLLQLGLALLRSARQGFSFGVQGFPELVFASLHVLLSLCHLRPCLLRRRPRGPRLLEEGEAPFLRRDNAGRGLRRSPLPSLLTSSPFCR